MELIARFKEGVTSAVHGLKESLKNTKMAAVAAVGVATTAVVSTAQAAVNFTPITELITATTGLIPSLLDLVVNIAPLIVTIAVVGFLVSFFKDSILGMMKM